MAVSLARRIRRIGLLPGKVQDPTVTELGRLAMISHLRVQAKVRRVKAGGNKK